MLRRSVGKGVRFVYFLGVAVPFSGSRRQSAGADRFQPRRILAWRQFLTFCLVGDAMMTSFRYFALAAGGAMLLGWLAAPLCADVLYVSTLNGTIDRYSRTGAGSVFVSGLSDPVGIAFDGAGDLFVVSKGANAAIEKFTPGGVGSVFASSGLDGPAGIALDKAGNVYVANEGNSTIEKFTPGGVGSVFASNGLSDPVGLAFDSAGNLYVSNADDMLGNYSIEKFTPGGVGSVFASGGLNTPLGLALDSAGNLYATNYGGSMIAELTPAGVSSVFASGLNDPYGLAFTNDAGVPLPLPATPTPEPSTFALVAAGALGVLGYGWRRRRRARRTTVPGDDAAPATLSFPPRSAMQARRHAA